MLATVTTLPVIGVPVQLDGLDSLLSIVQIPASVLVATVAFGGARNAGLLAVRILVFQAELRDDATVKGERLRAMYGSGERAQATGFSA